MLRGDNDAALGNVLAPADLVARPGDDPHQPQRGVRPADRDREQRTTRQQQRRQGGEDEPQRQVRVEQDVEEERAQDEHGAQKARGPARVKRPLADQPS